MDVTLISPYPDLRAIGLRFLSAALKKSGHTVKILFCPNEFRTRYDEQALEAVARSVEGTDLIGITLMTNFFDNAVQITQALKKRSDIPVIWGGIHPTIRPEECLKYADMVCLGEGEESLVELAEKLSGGRDFHDTRGIWFNDGGNIIKTETRPLVQDLNSIPFQDYSLDAHYILEEKAVRKVTPAHLDKFNEGKYMTFPTRGCPFACTYCCNNFFKEMYPGQSMVRKRRVANIMEELVEAKNKVDGIKCFYFDDDSFFLYSTEEIADFSRQYKEKIGLPLIITGGTPTTITREKLSLLIDAGMRFVRMGIQSGCESTKKMYKRNYSNRQVMETAKIISEFKNQVDCVQYDVIIDNPWETDDNLIETLRLLTRLPAPFLLAVFSMTFYPGTELYDLARQEGIISDDLRDVYRKYYHSCKKTYLNRLFLLLSSLEGRISPRTMALLTNKTLMKLGIGWLIYWTLRGKYLLNSSVRDLRKGDLSRILGHLRPAWMH